MDEQQYVNWRTAAKSYRNVKGSRMSMSPGLLRAREPYRVKNAITGTIVASFIVGVWWYSMMAVKQDNFDDVDEEAREMIASGVKAEEERKNAAGIQAAIPTPPAAPAAPAVGPSTTSTRSPSAIAAGRGVAVPVLERLFPRLLDPTRKTLVWGAPPVDRVGRMGERVI
ncbi:hypothetical protein OF83DRAFT_1161184 [Amylostereum chailletii]|nr:hypothetical protein OF83DRAFT_1161184 [Amylostereum chailletii]